MRCLLRYRLCVLLLVSSSSCGHGSAFIPASSHQIYSPPVHQRWANILRYRGGATKRAVSTADNAATILERADFADFVEQRQVVAPRGRGDGESTDADAKMDDALARLGVAGFQAALVLFVALVYAADGGEITAISLVTKPLVEKWNLEAWQRGLLGSSVYSGMFAGSFLCGPIADTHGRKPTLVAATAAMAAFGIISGFAPSFLVLCAIKILVGVGMGSSLPIAASMLQESLPKRIRGATMCLVFAGFNIGEIFVSRMGAKVFANGAKDPASSLFFIAATPALLSFVASLLMPESPRFLASNGKKQALLRWFKTTARLNCKSTEDVLGKNVDAALAELCTNTNNVQKSAAYPKEKKENFALAFVKKFGDVLRKDNLLKTLPLAFLWMATNLAFYGLIFSLPDLLQNAKTFSGLDSFNVADGMSLVNKYQPLALLFATAAVAAGLPYNTMFTVGYIVSAVAFFLASGSLANPHQMAALLAVAKCVQNGIFTTIYPATGEAFPTKTRATGTSFCATMGRSVAICVAPFVSFLLGRGDIAPLKAFAFVSLLGGVSSFLLAAQDEQADEAKVARIATQKLRVVRPTPDRSWKHPKLPIAFAKKFAFAFSS